MFLAPYRCWLCVADIHSLRTYITPTYFCSFYFVGRLRVVVWFCFRFLFWVCFRLFVGFDVICFALLLCVMLFALLLVLLCFVCLCFCRCWVLVFVCVFLFFRLVF